MLLLLIFSFLSGVAMIFAPCVWPILPIIFSASVTGDRRRPLAVIVGLALAFLVSILGFAYLFRILPLSYDGLRLLSVGVITFFGLLLVFPSFGMKMEAVLSRYVSRQGGGQTGRGWISGFVTGVSLGFLWSPCIGPILATIASAAATRTVSWEIALVALSFTAGLTLPLLLISWLGQRFLGTNRFFRPFLPVLRRGFGLLMLLMALAIYFDYDKDLQAALVDEYPVCSINDSIQARPDVLEALKMIGR